MMSWPEDITKDITKKILGVECYVIEDRQNKLESEGLRKVYIIIVVVHKLGWQDFGFFDHLTLCFDIFLGVKIP
jgi:hypothetical protein